MDHYVFEEYPKWVHCEGKESALVQNEAEEKAFMGAADAVATGDELIVAAETRGIKVDRRWSDKRLAEEIAKAG